MRAEQKIVMLCRQTGERAERLLEWLDQSRIMLKAQDRALRTEVQGISNELLTLVEAVEQPATAGLIGAWGSARAALIGALMQDAPAPPADETKQLRLGRDSILKLMPQDTDGGVAARIRLVASDRNDSPYRFPIQLSVLSQLDLVKILAGAYFVHVPPARQHALNAEGCVATLMAKANDALHQTFSGISRRDIDTLRDSLHATAPENRALRELDAGGYWDMLGGLIAHLPEAARRQAFALLWGEDPGLTALFNRLSDAIELLGFTGVVYTGLDAVLGREGTTGWMVRHDDSVIATKTIHSAVDHPERTIRVSSKKGRTAEVERFVLAALADEIRLPVDRAHLSLLEAADLLILPAPRPVMLWPNPQAAETDVTPRRGALSASEALEIFAAQKASHQIEQAVRRHTLTSLLVAADFVDRDGGTEIDAASAAQIANWIEITQGETPHARERRRTGIAILAAEGNGGGAAADAVLSGGEPDKRLAATVEAVLDGNKEWAHEWTPNRSFRNIFTWRPPRAVILPAPISGQPGSADILRFERIKGPEGTSIAPASAELAASYDLVNLQHAIIQATTTTIHNQQLSARLVELRRALAARFLRLHLSNDPAGVVEWRRQICHVARNRLQQSAQQGGFGRLQKALMFSEGEALAVLARLRIDDPREKSALAANLRTLEAAKIVEACLEAWIAAMRQSVRSPALMRAVNVPGTVVAHIVDELVIGALRIGLQEKLSEAVRRIQLSAARAIDCENSIAALMERGINAYVETLDPGARALRSSVHRDTRFGAMGAGPSSHSVAVSRPRQETERTDAARGATAAAARRPGQTSAVAISEDWAETFADLIEANILGASLLGGSGHLNRELGEVLAAISAGPFEGIQ